MGLLVGTGPVLLPAFLEALAAGEKGKEWARRFTAVWLSRSHLDAEGNQEVHAELCLSSHVSPQRALQLGSAEKSALQSCYNSYWLLTSHCAHKRRRCLPSFLSECKSFRHLMRYTMLGDIMGKKGRESGKQRCVLESCQPIVWDSVTRLGWGPQAEQEAPRPITPSAWLPMVRTGEEKPVIQYSSSTFNSTSKLSHANWSKGS